MQATDHFVWNADPNVFTIDFTLPYPIAIFGIVAALVIIYFGYPKLSPKSKTGKKEPEPEAWKVWALCIAAFIIGQLIFLIFPSPDFQSITRPIRWYGIMFASAFAFGYFMMYKIYKDAELSVEDLDKLLMYVLIATVIGARLGQVLFYNPEYYLRNPEKIIAIWEGGLASHGAAVGILLAMYFYVKDFAKMSFLWLADRVVIVVASGGAFIRIGNFFNSEIVGKPADVPWAIIFPQANLIPAGVPRHPSMLYEALLCIAIFILLFIIYKQYKNRPPEGSLFGIFLVTLFGGRFLLEYFKSDLVTFATGLFSMGQWLSIPLIIAGIWVLINKVDWNQAPVISTKEK